MDLSPQIMNQLRSANPDATDQELAEGYLSYKSGQGSGNPQTPAGPVTPADIMSQEHPPIASGWAAAKKAFGEGYETISKPSVNPYAGVVGGLQMLSAPFAGIGEAAGTAAQNLTANADPNVSAAVGTLANLGAQTLGGKYIPKILSKGARSIATMFSGGATKEDLVNAFASGNMNLPESPGARARAIQTAGESLYHQAEQLKTPVPASGVNAAIQDAYIRAKKTPGIENKDLTDILEQLHNKWGGRKTGSVYSAGYNAMLELEQSINQRARDFLKGTNPNGGAAKALFDLSDKILTEMDQTSPMVRQANQIYRASRDANKVLDALGSGDVGTQIERLMRHDQSIARSFNLSPGQMDEWIEQGHIIGSAKATQAQKARALGALMKTGIGVAGTAAGGDMLTRYFFHRGIYDLVGSVLK